LFNNKIEGKMPVKLRLQRHGRTKAPFYHIVVADSRSPRDGRFIEKIGTYNPMTKPATIVLDNEKAYQWLLNGAQPTDTVNAILRYKGVLYKKHLMRGVAKGAMSIEDAMVKYEEFMNSKESVVAKVKEATKKEKQEKHQFIFGTPKAKKVKEAPAPIVEEAPAVEDAPEATEEVAVVTESAVEEVAAVTEPAVEEVALVTETVVEEVVVMEQGEDQEFAQIENVAEATPEAEVTETPAEDAPADETTEA
jgi:small subunit ribosomal protein S16